MSVNSIDLFLYLIQNKSIKCSTIDSLIKYGFNTNDTLIAMDFDLDFPQMADIYSDQKSVLREILNAFKNVMNNSIINKDCISVDKCFESEILDQIEENNGSSLEQLIKRNQELEKQIDKKEKIIEEYQNELKFNQIKRESLRLKIQEINENKKLGNQFQNQISVNENHLKGFNTSLLTRNKNNARVHQNMTLSLHHFCESVSNQTTSLTNIKPNIEPIIPEEKKQIKKSLESISKPYKCQYKDCNKSFVTTYVLKRHINSIHKKLNVQSFKCDYKECELNFTRKSEYNNHMKSHSSYKPYICRFNNCVMSFGDSHHYKRHMNTVHKLALFECHFDDCNKKFIEESDLKAHINRHYDKKPYKCVYNECYFSSNTSADLKRHISAVHEKVKSFECHFKDCKKSFANKSNLKEHMDRHLGYRPFKCQRNECHFSSTTSSDMRKHIRSVHLKEKPYQCHNCTKKFVRSKQLSQHINKNH